MSGTAGGCSGFRQAPSPIATGVTPSAAATGRYSPFWSAGTANRRPNAAARTAATDLTSADLPDPTVPATNSAGFRICLAW